MGIETAQLAGKRLTRKGEETRGRIVAAAAQLMYERGVTEATLEDVRAAAGVSGSQIYHYFADKQALTSAVIEHQSRAILGGQRQMLSRLDSLEALRAWRDAVVSAQRELRYLGGCPLGSLASELAEHEPQARTSLARSFSQWSGAIRDGLRQMIEHGVLSSGTDADRLSLALLAALQGGLLLGQTQRDSTALEAALDTVIERIEQQAVARSAPSH